METLVWIAVFVLSWLLYFYASRKRKQEVSLEKTHKPKRSTSKRWFWWTGPLGDSHYFLVAAIGQNEELAKATLDPDTLNNIASSHFNGEAKIGRHVLRAISKEPIAMLSREYEAEIKGT